MNTGDRRDLTWWACEAFLDKPATRADVPRLRGARTTTDNDCLVDVPALGSAELRLQVAFPRGYGFVMVHAMQISAHSPPDRFTPDPTPHDACALRVVNSHLAPAGYMQSLLDAAGSCTAN